MTDNNINNSDWIRLLNDKISEAEKPVPEGAWEALRVRMNGAPTPIGRSHRRKRGMSAAAAVLAGAILGTAVYLSMRSDINADKPAVITATNNISSDVRSTTSAETARPAVSGPEFNITATPHTGFSSKSATDREPEPWSIAQVTQVTPGADEAEPAEVINNDITSPHSDETQKSAESTSHEQQATEPVRSTVNASTQASVLTPIDIKTRIRNRLTISAYGNGVILADRSGSASATRRMFIPTDGGTAYAAPRVVKYKYSHKIPINFGVNVSKEVAKNISIGTGLNYSLLISDVYSSSDIKGEKLRQKVQFIGIPFNVKW